ncbi:MAG: signal recognition particle-docking protein FtsY [Oscillospiraceae bacterium]|nr:signal recognition particle-docking protein FtsY [Oscillospiraceae bacterium]
MGFFDKIKKGLEKTRKSFSESLESILNTGAPADEDFLEELEETLILADLGMDTVMKVMGEIRGSIAKRDMVTTTDVSRGLKKLLKETLNVGSSELNLSTTPSVILVIGVNGVGKTTTIGKIAKQLTSQGKKVTLVAGDTFRAAAADQLEIWAERSGASIVRQTEGADPASVVFDGIQSAKAKGSDVVIIDTAGRLHNKTNLMNELNKISRIVNRELPDAAKEVLLVLDGTTGQNGLIQAKTFKEIAGVTAIAITKLDGTAKGGIVIGVADVLKVPVKFVGVGEQVDDLMPFNANEFVDALIEDKK